ncbi:MAG: ATP synthase F1 subunit delta [Actinomycetota bacterium]
MSSDHIDGYAKALLAVAEAEGSVESVRGELAEVSRAVEGNDELRSTLSNNLLPAAVRGQIVDDILANKTSNATRALVGMIVSAGRAGDMSAIVDSFVAQAAGGSGRQVATVRSAVPLSDDQVSRLSAALSKRAGTDVELYTIVDPTVVGGIVTTMGDTVIDGSVRSRLNQMRESL